MSPIRVDDEPATCLLYRDLHGRKPETVVGAKGSYLFLDDGRRCASPCDCLLEVADRVGSWTHVLEQQ